VASYRKLPSGKWQASVSVPVKGESGRAIRRTKTHPLKRVVSDWATQLEAAVSAGAWQDPRESSTTLREYREKWRASHISDQATVKKTDSQWRSHVEPIWGGYPLSAITRAELKTWVHRMHTEECARCRRFPGLSGSGKLVKHKNAAGNSCSGSGADPGLGAWTIQGAASHLSGLLSSAVEDGLLPANPAARLRLPTARPKAIFYWTRDEAARIGMELKGSDALAVELAMHVGLRPGELFGLRKPFVDITAWLINVAGVTTRDGWRPHAKTSKSHRAVPVPHHLREPLDLLLMSVGPNGIVFPAPDGGLWDDRNFAQRVFIPAVTAAGVRSGSPYDMRHTAASWLVQAGVPLYDVQRLLGHEKFTTTERYAHLAPGEFSAVLDAWGSVPPIDIRTKSPAAREPHEPVERR
jgi:integrase